MGLLKKSRWVLLLTLAWLLAFAGCKSLKLEHAKQTSETDWLTEGDSPERRQATRAEVVPPLEEAWVYNATAAFGPGSPLLLGNYVLVSTRKGEIHAIDVETGKRRGIDGFGVAVEGTPGIHGGMLIVPVGWGNRSLFGYDLTRGKTRWKKKGAPIETGVLSLDDTFVVGDAQGTVRRHTVDTGEVLWEYQFEEGVSVRSTPVFAGGHVVVASERGHVVSLQPDDGTVQWTRTLEAPVYTSFAAYENTLFIPTTRGRFYALDARDGAIRWKLALPDTTVRFSPPAVDAGLVVVGASDGFLRAFDPTTGELRWSFEVDEAFAAAPLMTPERVYIGSMAGMVYGVDRATGGGVWEHRLRGRVKSALAARDGYLIVLSEPHFVYLFRSASVGDYEGSL